MRVISWNMAAGFDYDPERHDRAWGFLRELDPDIALLQEAVAPAWAVEHWPGTVAARKYPARAGHEDVPWGSAILSRRMELVPYDPPKGTWLEDLWGSVAVARIDGPVPLWLASIHSNAYPIQADRLANRPVGELRRCHPKDIWEIEIIAPEIETLFAGDAFVVGGDLNSGLLFDTKKNYDYNARLFRNLAEGGFVDLRSACGVELEEQTYFKAGKCPYQLDHLFADAETAARATSWRVLPEPATVEMVSDHAPIEAVFDDLEIGICESTAAVE